MPENPSSLTTPSRPFIPRAGGGSSTVAAASPFQPPAVTSLPLTADTIQSACDLARAVHAFPLGGMGDNIRLIPSRYQLGADIIAGIIVFVVSAVAAFPFSKYVHTLLDKLFHSKNADLFIEIVAMW